MTSESIRTTSGGGELDDLNTANDWVSYMMRYMAKACEFGTPKEVGFRHNMIKAAALAVAAIEAYERNGQTLPPRHYDVLEEATEGE